MPRPIDYYFSLVSPWAFIGHAMFMDTARRHGLEINYKPVFLGRVFAETGGLPLDKRHPVRQRYRLVELQRWRETRGLSFKLKPKYWPFEVNLADRTVIAIQAMHQDPDPFLRAAFAAIWQDERNLGDRAVLREITASVGLDAQAVQDFALRGAAEAIYTLNLENAIAADVFGSPAYVLDGEVFWGQDRLELLNDALGTGREAYRAAV
jgi:2-hydroxychromene-2-carboxylate isomerase